MPLRPSSTLAEWFWLPHEGAKPSGPITFSKLQSMAADGKLKREHKIWRKGLDEYVLATTLSGLFTDESPPGTGDQHSAPEAYERVRRNADAGAQEESAKHERERHRSEQQRTSEAVKYARILGLRGQVTIRDIKKAYRSHIAMYHPDKVSHLGEEIQMLAEKKSKELNEAYHWFQRRYRF